MSDVALTASQRWRSLGAVVACMTVTALIHGLSMPLLALVLDRQGVDEAMIGLNTATQALAVLFVAPITPRVIGALGPARTMVGAIAVSIVVFLLLPAWPNVYAWFPLRFVLGIAGSFMWTAGESWINQIAEERTRGRVVAFYTAAISGGFALGPLVLTQTGSVGWPPFLATAAIMVASMVPLFFVLGIAPRMEGRPSARLYMFLLLAPSAMLLNFVFAATDGALLTFLPIYGLRVGLAEANTLYLITLMGIGGIASQPLIGWLADHMNRRALLVACTIVMVAGALAMPLVLPHEPFNMVYMFVFGGVISGLYSIGVVLLGERFKGADLAAAATVFSVMWGLGNIVGPPVGGVAIDRLGPDGLPYTVALFFLLYLPVPILGWFRRRRAS